jgi:CMP-N,N'-diacetyllegionaminic acid synthase
MNNRILAIIPARSGSKRINNKNIINLKGHPLIAYTIKTAIKSGVFDTIAFSSDSKYYNELANSYGIKDSLLRITSLSTDGSKSIDVIRDIILFYKLKKISFDYIVLLQPTSPLRKQEDILESIKKIREFGADSLVSVSSERRNCHPLLSILKESTFYYSKKLNKDEVYETNMNEKIFYPNGAIYIFRTEFIMNSENYYGNNTILFPMGFEASIDIDTLEDFLELLNLVSSDCSLLESL